MDKQLLEQEAKMWVSENWKPTRVAAYIAGATSSSTVKNLERERNDWKQKYMSCEADLTIQETENDNLEREVERLKGLIKSQFFKYYDDDFQQDIWETFKTENQL